MNIVLIGATSGIGLDIAEKLSMQKHNLYIGSSNEDKLNEVKSKLNCSGTQIDVSDIDNFELFFNQACNALDNIDVIINCVGSILLKPSHMAHKKEILDTYALNTFNSIGTIKYGVNYLRKKGGSIILFSSAAASIGLKNHDIISSAKGAINSLVKSAAMSYANNNVRINAIAPGLVDTPLSSKITSNSSALDYSIQMHPINRIGKPQNITKCVEWLIDKDSDWITGQTITIDGGLSTLKK